MSGYLGHLKASLRKPLPKLSKVENLSKLLTILSITIYYQIYAEIKVARE